MTHKEIRLYLELLDQYLSNHNTYAYAIQSMITFDGGICFSITEYAPTYQAKDPYILILQIIGHSNLSVRNSDGNDCVYDYLEEARMAKEEADRESAIYRKTIESFFKK